MYSRIIKDYTTLIGTITAIIDCASESDEEPALTLLSEVQPIFAKIETNPQALLCAFDAVQKYQQKTDGEDLTMPAWLTEHRSGIVVSMEDLTSYVEQALDEMLQTNGYHALREIWHAARDVIPTHPMIAAGYASHILKQTGYRPAVAA